MATVVKVARTAQELDDVLWLRHEVYVLEDGKFGGSSLPSERIVDRFDALPTVANIIAYDEGVPAGTLRINLDSGAGLPAEEYYDFCEFRGDASSKSYEPNKLKFASGGMLAIREKWRRRRDVIQALFKTAIGMLNHWGVSHMIASVNYETVSIYRRLGFQPLEEAIWIDSIGNKIVPMGASFETVFDWAFSDLLDSDLNKYWLDTFSSHFERLLLAPGEIIFEEGENASHAYIVDNGWVAISRKDPEEREFTLATLSKGALIGELALIDHQARSASAVACTHTELIQLDQESFFNTINDKPDRLYELLKAFAQRLRRTDDLAMVMAYAPQTERIIFALSELRRSARPDPKVERSFVAKIGPSVLAKSAGVREYEVRRLLELEKTKGVLDYGEKYIRFYSD